MSVSLSANQSLSLIRTTLRSETVLLPALLKTRRSSGIRIKTGLLKLTELRKNVRMQRSM